MEVLLREGKLPNEGWIPGRICNGKGANVSLPRNAMVNWLKRNWEVRFSNFIELTLNGKLVRCLVKDVQFKPAITNFNLAIIHVDLISLKHLQEFGNLNVNLPLKFTNANKLRFGVLIKLMRSIKVRVRTEHFPMQVKVDLPRALTHSHRTLRLSDLKFSEGYDIDLLTKSSKVLCRLLRSSKERKTIHEKWIDMKVKTKAS